MTLELNHVFFATLYPPFPRLAFCIDTLAADVSWRTSSYGLEAERNPCGPNAFYSFPTYESGLIDIAGDALSFLKMYGCDEMKLGCLVEPWN